jgi:hypothetical protein
MGSDWRVGELTDAARLIPHRNDDLPYHVVAVDPGLEGGDRPVQTVRDPMALEGSRGGRLKVCREGPVEPHVEALVGRCVGGSVGFSSHTTRLPEVVDGVVDVTHAVRGGEVDIEYGSDGAHVVSIHLPRFVTTMVLDLESGR